MLLFACVTAYKSFARDSVEHDVTSGVTLVYQLPQFLHMSHSIIHSEAIQNYFLSSLLHDIILPPLNDDFAQFVDNLTFDLNVIHAIQNTHYL